MKKNKRYTGKVKKQHSYKFYFFITIFLISLFIIALSLFAGFISSEKLVQEQVEFSQKEISENILHEINTINKGLEIYDMSLNNRIETDFIYFMDEYEKSGGNPSFMDLASVAEKTGDDITLYVINESSVITHSTNPDSIGFDFKIYTPDYTEYLKNIRESGGFFPERVMTEYETGLQKKFGYFPTPDHKYILEISLYDEKFNSIRKELKYSENVERIAQRSPYLKNARLFNIMHRQVGNSSFSADGDFSAFLDEIFASKKGKEIIDKNSGDTLRYLYIPLENDEYGSDDSLIAELTLDKGPLNSMMSGIIMQYIILSIFSTGLCIGCIVIVTHHFSSEIKGIVDDISVISRGDLSHKIRDSNSSEFLILKDSINQMVEKISENISMYKKSQESFIIEREKAQTYFSLADVIFIISDKNGLIQDINKKSLDILGYTKEEAVGKNFFSIVFTDNNREIVKSLFSENINSVSKLPFNFSCKAKTKTGEKRDVNLSTVLLKDSHGEITGWITTGSDVTDELAIKKELESSLSQKNALLREVHHRVKNNLQIIISLFDLRSYCTSDKKLLNLLQESKSRVNTMALVHEIMFRSGDFTKVNLSEYTREIVAGLFASLMPETKITVDYDMDEIFFDLDHSVPYGILINELLSNSLNHAFIGRETGRILISLKKSGNDNIILTFSDDGCGLPPEETLKIKETLGLNLITNLVRQLSGKMSIIRNNGTKFVIEIENPKEQIRF